MKNQVTNGFKKDPADELLGKAVFTHSQITAHTDVFANPEPSMAAMETLCNELKAAIVAAGTRDSIKIALLNDKKMEMVNFMQRVGLYVDMVADGSRTIALMSGMELRKIPAPRTLEVPGAPKVSRATALGSIDASCGVQAAARSYRWYISTDSSLALQDWEMTEGTSKVTLTGCTPGVAYYVCAVLIGYRKQRVESPVVKIVA